MKGTNRTQATNPEIAALKTPEEFEAYLRGRLRRMRELCPEKTKSQIIDRIIFWARKQAKNNGDPENKWAAQEIYVRTRADDVWLALDEEAEQQLRPTDGGEGK